MKSRAEQIAEAGQNFCKSRGHVMYYEAFEKGAEWADKNPIIPKDPRPIGRQNAVAKIIKLEECLALAREALEYQPCASIQGAGAIYHDDQCKKCESLAKINEVLK